MREIKVRGKSKNTDHQQVVYGYGCYTDQNDRIFIITDSPVPMTYVQVEEAQLYTGLKDKNGKEIYEGDVVATSDDLPQKLVVMEWNPELSGWPLTPRTVKAFQCEVIGNIYENPDFLTIN